MSQIDVQVRPPAHPEMGRSEIMRVAHQDRTMMALIAASLLAAGLLHAAKFDLWADEILTWRIISLEAFGAFWAAVTDVIGGFPVYFLLLRMWAAVAGATALSLRLFSTLAMIGALLVLWPVLRRSFSRDATAIGLFSAFFLSPTFLFLLGDARYYGLLAFEVAIAVAVYDRLARGAEAGSILALDGIAQAVLVLTHPYGGLFSALIGAALVTGDIVRGRLRPVLYAVHAAGWSALLLWWAPMMRQIAGFEPHGWVKPPRLADLLSVTGGELAGLAPACLALAAVAGIVGLRGRPLGGRVHTVEPGRSAPMLAIFFCAAPLLSFALSKLFEPTFVPRYLLPALIGYAVLLAWIAEAHIVAPLAAVPSQARERLLVIVYIAALLLAPPALITLFRSSPNLIAADERFGHSGLDIVVEDGNDFEVRASAVPSRYVFLLDPEIAATADNARAGISDFRIMEGLSRHFPFYRVDDARGYLATHRRFLLLDDESNRWAEKRLFHRPEQWRIEELGPALTFRGQPARMLLIERER